jgi:hypothetical protein
MSENVIKKYMCPVCKINHDISFPKNMAKKYTSFPFTYVITHKFENSTNVDEKNLDILTTLYIDANLSIRGVEAMKLTTSDIISKDDSREMCVKLMNHITELQKNYDDLFTKYQELEKKLKK